MLASSKVPCKGYGWSDNRMLSSIPLISARLPTCPKSLARVGCLNREAAAITDIALELRQPDLAPKSAYSELIALSPY